MAINALAGMGILTEDESLVDAALSEIQSLSIERRQELDPRRDVTYLLVQHHLGQVISPIPRISKLLISESRVMSNKPPGLLRKLCTPSHQTCNYAMN